MYELPLVEYDDQEPGATSDKSLIDNPRTTSDNIRKNGFGSEADLLLMGLSYFMQNRVNDVFYCCKMLQRFFRFSK